MRCAATTPMPASNRLTGQGSGTAWQSAPAASRPRDGAPRKRGRDEPSPAAALLGAGGEALVLDLREDLGGDVARRVVAVHARHAELTLGVLRRAHGLDHVLDRLVEQ